MSRFLTALVAVYILVLVPTAASAQDQPMPGRGEILELRRNDPRYQEGYRSFIYGSWVPGMDGLNDLLDRVNADLEGESLVTMEQLDAANSCIVIYHRDGHRFGHNGICDTNSTAERVTYASYCEGDSSCARWPMANRVYRIPSRPRLTPGERAEEMVHTLDGTTVTETVPAPAELGSWMTELSDLMGEEQAPSYDQVRHVLAAVGRTLTRAETASSAPSAATAPGAATTAETDAADMMFGEDEVPGTSADEATSRPTSAEEDEAHTSSTSSGVTTSILSNPSLLWSIIAILSVALILLLLKDKIRAWYRPTSLDEEQESPTTEIAPPSPTREQERDKKFSESLARLWKQYCKLDVLSEESLNLYFMTADSNRVLAGKYEQDLRARTSELEALKKLPAKIEYREDAKRVRELEAKLQTMESARSTAEANLLTAGFEHSAQEKSFSGEREVWSTERAELSRKFRKLEDELESFKDKAKLLVEKFYQDGIANLDMALDHASSTDTSQPGFIGVLKRIDQARNLFKGMVSGVLNDLMIHLESDLAMVPAMAGDSSYLDRREVPEPSVPESGDTDSWTGVLDESIAELAAERTSLGARIPGFAGFPEPPPELEPASIPPKGSDVSIPPAESLVSPPTHPGLRVPEPGHADDVGFRMSQHAPPPAKPVGRAQRKRERKTTDSFERAAVKKDIQAETAPRDRDDEKTAVFDQGALDRKRVEARTGKTITPGGTRAATDDSPIPGSLVPPPPPNLLPTIEYGEEPDPTVKPGLSSIFDDQPGSSEETGVTVKRVVGSD